MLRGAHAGAGGVLPGGCAGRYSRRGARRSAARRVPRAALLHGHLRRHDRRREARGEAPVVRRGPLDVRGRARERRGRRRGRQSVVDLRRYLRQAGPRRCQDHRPAAASSAGDPRGAERAGTGARGVRPLPLVLHATSGCVSGARLGAGASADVRRRDRARPPAVLQPRDGARVGRAAQGRRGRRVRRQVAAEGVRGFGQG